MLIYQDHLFSSTNIGNYFSFLKYSDSSETDVQKHVDLGPTSLRHKTLKILYMSKIRIKLNF